VKKQGCTALTVGSGSPLRPSLHCKHSLLLFRQTHRFQTQLSMSSKAKPDTGLYLSLRKDGRVRSSGMGSPPWGALVAQLPQEDGLFKGFLDGMDGKV